MSAAHELADLTAAEVRARIRVGDFSGTTAGLAPSRMQANLAIVPAEHADAFRAFCAKNPRPCPLLAVSEPGDPKLPALGADVDVRSDLSGYRVWRDGELFEERSDVADLWRDDLVAFALGCSFGFEAALLAAGVPLPHVASGRNVAMYDTSIALEAVGPFSGRMVASMRLIPEDRLDEVVEISTRFPHCHGAPVHIGDPSEIGVASLDRPDYGEAPLGTGAPVFWACGVTPQAALRRARLPFAITHSPGKMLVCDTPADGAGPTTAAV